eukprot:1159766-Pelagomonas_calceolata.AAC.7
MPSSAPRQTCARSARSGRARTGKPSSTTSECGGRSEAAAFIPTPPLVGQFPGMRVLRGSLCGVPTTPPQWRPGIGKVIRFASCKSCGGEAIVLVRELAYLRPAKWLLPHT